MKIYKINEKKIFIKEIMNIYSVNNKKKIALLLWSQIILDKKNCINHANNNK